MRLAERCDDDVLGDNLVAFGVLCVALDIVAGEDYAVVSIGHCDGRVVCNLDDCTVVQNGTIYGRFGDFALKVGGLVYGNDGRVGVSCGVGRGSEAVMQQDCGQNDNYDGRCDCPDFPILFHYCDLYPFLI